MIEYQQSAYLLHSRPYRENQQMLSFITENEGKISAIAYVGQAGKSHKKGLLQPFSPLNISLKGKGSLKQLTRVEADGKSFRLTGNYLYCGFYLNELLEKLLVAENNCSLLYSEYCKSLKCLALNDDIELTLRKFEYHLLDELGQGIDFSLLDDIETEQCYYLIEEGFKASHERMQLPLYSKSALQAIASHQLDSQNVLKNYKLLMRQIISHLLGSQQLHSRKLFKK